jgi:hypothetical protein
VRRPVRTLTSWLPRLPHADLRVGPIEQLPWPDDSFDVVSGFNAFQFGADFVAALAIGTDLEPYRAAGATWWLAEFAADAASVDRVHAVIRDGPIAHP